MSKKFVAQIPPDFDLPANFIVQVTAVDPTTGALVTGVNVSNVALMAAKVEPDTSDSGPLFEPVTPLWLPTPIDDQTAGN